MAVNVTCQPREKFWRDKRGATERSEPTWVDSLHVSHADIFKSQMRAAGVSPTQRQINLEYYVFYKYGGHDPTIAGYVI